MVAIFHRLKKVNKMSNMKIPPCDFMKQGVILTVSMLNGKVRRLESVLITPAHDISAASHSHTHILMAIPINDMLDPFNNPLHFFI